MLYSAMVSEVEKWSGICIRTKGWIAATRFVRNFNCSLEMSQQQAACVRHYKLRRCMCYIGLCISSDLKRQLYSRFSLRCRREAARCFMSWNILLSHSRSLKAIENGTIRKLVYGFLFAFHSNCGRIFNRFDTIHERDSQIANQPATARPYMPRLCIVSK